MGIDIDDKTFDAIIEELRAEVVPILKSQAEQLKKGEGSASASPAEASASGSASPAGGGEGSASAPGSDGPPSGPPGADGSAMSAAPSPAGPPGSPPAGPPSPSPAGPPGSPPGASPSASPGGMPADPNAIAAMIAQMPPDQQKVVYLAAKQALMAGMGAGAPPSPAGPSPMAPPPGASPAAPPSPSPAPMAMSEGSAGAKAPQSASPGVMSPNGNGEAVLQSVHKAEAAVAEMQKLMKADKAEKEKLMKTVEEQGKSLDLAVKAVTLLTNTPMRKAVTRISEVTPLVKNGGGDEPRPMTKSEVNSRLSEQIRSGTLEKKDRERIRKFYDQGSVDLTLIQHLLTE